MKFFWALVLPFIMPFFLPAALSSRTTYNTSFLNKTSAQSGQQPFIHATKRARQSIVSIYTITKTSIHLWERFGESSLSLLANKNTTERITYLRGSGFVISKDGYILTNNHIVDNAQSITVQFLDGRESPATIIGQDPTTDIALIKIKKHNLIPLELADSLKVEIGEWVIAIGNPHGYKASVSAGIISGNFRSHPGGSLVQQFFQTDAALHHGHSGGPLLNLDGDVVGMVTTTVTEHGENTRIGLAIPSNLLKTVLHDLMSRKKPVRGHVGLLLLPVTAPKVGATDPGQWGNIFVLCVTPGSSADQAGFVPGDIICALRNDSMPEVGQLRTVVALSKPGEELPLVVLRNGNRIPLHVTVEKLVDPSPEACRIQTELGMKVQHTLVSSKNRPDVKTGFFISEIDTEGRAYKSGLRTGQIIFSINGQWISSIDKLVEALCEKSFFPLALIHVLEGNSSSYIFFSR